MSDTTITAEERGMWASTAAARINAVTPERQCEITAQERLIKALKDLEQAEARAEKAEKELAGADAEIAELRDELEDSRGTEKDAPNVLCAIARLVGVYEHSQELGDDMGTLVLEAVSDLLAEKQKYDPRALRWTNEPPKVAGWYPWRSGKGQNMTMIQIHVFNGVCGFWDGNGVFITDLNRGEWAGPIPAHID